MKKIVFILCLIIPISLYSNNSNRLKKIDKFINNLKLELEGLFNNQEVAYEADGKIHKVEEFYKSYVFLRGGSPFIREIEVLPMHNILNEFDNDESLNIYLDNYINTIVGSDVLRSNIVIETGETDILNINCPFEDKKNDLKLILASFTQNIKYKGKETISIDFIIGIDITNEDQYLLKFIYYNKISGKNYTTTCNYDDKKVNDKKINSVIPKVNTFLDEQLNNAHHFYNKKEYYNAKKTYQSAYEILKVNGIYDKEKEKNILMKIKECSIKISDNKKQVLETLFKRKRFSELQKELSKIKEEELLNSEWYKTLVKRNNKSIERKNNQIKLDLADYNYKTNNYKKALTAYQNLTTLRFLDQSYIASQIKKCKEADPRFIEKILSKAYDDAVKSKKNWLSTFKTYYKYENSGYLKASQFYFMMQMMLDRKRSRIGKPMGFSRNKMNLLAKKYFYEAKDRGYNVSYVENHIFTKSITKYKK